MVARSHYGSAGAGGMKILVLLSGGLDSAAVLADLVRDHHCIALGFDYGQKHSMELERASVIAAHYHVVFARQNIESLPLVNDVVFAGRNLVMASLAIAHAQSTRCQAIAIGCNASDWLRFPDCRPAFWRAVAAAAEAYDVKVLTPLIYHSKRDVVDRARELGVPLDATWSCYSPNDGKPCGDCLACKTRNEALAA